MRRFTLLFTIFLLTNVVFGQFNFLREDAIQVVNGDTLLNPWGGGLNNPQFSSIDLNFDGVKDVFVFDKSSDVIRTFLSVETSPGVTELIHHPEYESKFPQGMRYRTALVDYNCDGKEDLFAYSLVGFKVFKNIGNIEDGLLWEEEYPQLQSLQYGEMANVFTAIDDISALDDVDGDGDLDILAFASNNELVEYHRNYAVENLGRCDTLVLELRNDCWGGFRESMSSSEIILNDQDFPCQGSTILNPNKSVRHAGSTILSLDIDNSGVKDLVIGDASSDRLYLLLNSGSMPNSNSIMDSIDTLFPSYSLPVDLKTFPASFYLDVDNDNTKDLVVTPNYKSLCNNYESVWFYRNTGSNALPVFDYVQNNFLQDEMIEVGNGAIPIFFDYNLDGLQDLVVGSFFKFVPPNKKSSRFTLYENVGTQNEPVFEFVSDDYLDFSQEGIEFRKIPAFGDIDNDGDDDMYLGSQNGSIRFYRNTAGFGQEASFTLESFQIQDSDNNTIDVGTYSAPTLFDLNKDGLLDLIIGKKNGWLTYYQNTGTINTPVFTLINDSLGMVDVSPVNNEGYAAPQFVDVNDTIQLFVGARDGFVHTYRSIEDHLEEGDEFELVSHEYLSINQGDFSSVAIIDIDNDSRLDLFLGQDLGGIAHYEADTINTSTIDISEHNKMNYSIYPNPSSSSLYVDFGAGLSMFYGKRVQIHSVDGVFQKSVVIRNNIVTIDVSNLSNGLYVLKCNGTPLVEKFIKK